MVTNNNRYEAWNWMMDKWLPISLWQFIRYFVQPRTYEVRVIREGDQQTIIGDIHG